MIVRCISTFPSENQLQRLGPSFFRERDFGVVVDQEYVVFGLSIHTDSRRMGTGAWVDILPIEHTNILVPVPLCLFLTVDARVSRYWEMRLSNDGIVSFRPPSFYREYYMEDVSNGVSEVVEEFSRVRALIEIEAGQQVGSAGRQHQ